MCMIFVQSSDTKIHLNNGQIELNRGIETLASYPEKKVESIAILGNAQITTQTVKRCLQLGIGIIYASTNGKYYGQSSPLHSLNTKRLVRQVQRFSSVQTRRLWAAALLKAKFQAEAIELRRIQNNHWADVGDSRKRLAELSRKLPEASTLGQLMGLEAMAAKITFHAFAAALPPAWEWHGRARNPPANPANSLLSLSGALVTQKLQTACAANGLHPELGFLHADGYYRPNLVLDLLELFRPLLCEHLTLQLSRRHILTPDDFQSTSEFGCRLRPEKFPDFWERFNFLVNSRSLNLTGKPLTSRLVSLVQTALDSDSLVPAFSSLLPSR